MENKLNADQINEFIMGSIFIAVDETQKLIEQVGIDEVKRVTKLSPQNLLAETLMKNLLEKEGE
jgi:hypothetical protein